MKPHFFFFFQVLLISLMGCSTSSSNDPLLEEAYQHHQAAMSIHDSVISKINALKQQVSTIQDEDSTANGYLRALQAIEQDFELWDESLVSVPGYETEHEHNHDHDHDHDHDHHHSHDELKDMSPEQVLELQKGLKVEIARLNEKADSLLAVIAY